MEYPKTNWNEIIRKYPEWEKIETFLEQERKNYWHHLDIFPPAHKRLKCFNYFNIEGTKVVILGQDPYHRLNQATGLCFGVYDVIPPPPSLKNIMKELKSDIGVELTSQSLEQWAKQGILLMNTALTVRQKTPASHMKIWLPFTKYIIDYLNKTQKGIVFVAWGAFAYDKLKEIDKNKHHLIVSSHPSPLSAYKKFGEFPSFLGSKPFSKINKFVEIEWA